MTDHYNKKPCLTSTIWLLKLPGYKRESNRVWRITAVVRTPRRTEHRTSETFYNQIYYLWYCAAQLGNRILYKKKVSILKHLSHHRFLTLWGLWLCGWQRVLLQILYTVKHSASIVPENSDLDLWNHVSSDKQQRFWDLFLSVSLSFWMIEV